MKQCDILKTGAIVMNSLRSRIFRYVKKKYQTVPEFLWKSFPDYAVLRHGDNSKWYGIIMNIPGKKLDFNMEGRVDVLNVKLGDPYFADMLIHKEGYFRGYHMGRGNWVSVLLDGTVPFKEICGLLDESFIVTGPGQKKQKERPPKEWIVPANPKYYDVIQAFEESEEIDWKQGRGITVGDTVFLYVAAPVSAILYCCKVTRTDIPYEYKDTNVTIRALMKIRLKKRYNPEEFPFHILKEKYGVFAVRGPRGIPYGLSCALKK